MSFSTDRGLLITSLSLRHPMHTPLSRIRLVSFRVTCFGLHLCLGLVLELLSLLYCALCFHTYILHSLVALVL